MSGLSAKKWKCILVLNLALNTHFRERFFKCPFTFVSARKLIHFMRTLCIEIIDMFKHTRFKLKQYNFMFKRWYRTNWNVHCVRQPDGTRPSSWLCWPIWLRYRVKESESQHGPNKGKPTFLFTSMCISTCLYSVTLSHCKLWLYSVLYCLYNCEYFFRLYTCLNMSYLLCIVMQIHAALFHVPGSVPFSPYGADRIVDVVIVRHAVVEVFRCIRRSDVLWWQSEMYRD